MVYKIADNIYSPLGATTAENYQAVAKGDTVLSRHTGMWHLPEPFCAQMFSEQQKADMQIEGYSCFEQMVIASMKAAISDAPFDVKTERTVFILSTTKGEIGLLDTEQRQEILPAESAQRIADYFAITTTPIVVCNACISGLSAIILAERLLESHHYDYAIVCGADTVSRFIVAGFQSLKALSADACRPFDIERVGLNLGEAAATLILGREEKGGDARWRLSDGVIRNDAFHISSPSKSADGAYLALATLSQKTDIDSVAFINAHGTATLFNDQMESVAIERAGLGDIAVNAYKGYYGHTMGAAGVLETILSMAAIDEHKILATKGFDEIGVSGNIHVVKESTDTQKHSFIKMISGFGGGNAAILATNSSAEGFPDTGASPHTTTTTHRVVITPQELTLDGEELIESSGAQDFLTSIYKRYIDDYPKFYKMDKLCRLGFVASELLLRAEGAPRFSACAGRAIVLFNHTSSILSDRRFIASIADSDNYYPSPSVFVYTLPNIVTGEIAMRNHYHGETSFYILAHQDQLLMEKILEVSFADEKTESIIGGWVDYQSDNDYKADIQIIKRK